jgi:hypothetical protein
MKHLVFYVKNDILTFRLSDGRQGSEPLKLLNETVITCCARLKRQLGLDDKVQFENIGGPL